MCIWLFRCLSALTFLTKIPIPYNPSIEDKDFQRNIIFFPVVGLILGVILYLCSWVFSFRLSPLMVSVLIVGIYVILTGGLHLDGVGDSFDGLFSYRDKPRILEIMKDSRIGTNGILGIVFVLLIKFVSLNNLIVSMEMLPIILMPLVGRMALVIACYKGKNARENGMGKTYIGNISNKDFFVTILIAVVLVCSCIFMKPELTYIMIIAIIISLIYVIVLRNFVYKKIDGITGDILGLACETSETVFLVVCLFLI